MNNSDAIINYERTMNLTDIKELARSISGFCLHSDDYDLSIKLCKHFVTHPNIDIRANAIGGLGYIGMNFKKIDRKFAKSLLSKALQEDNFTIKAAATDALDYLQRYVKGFHVNIE